ncbi:MAG: malonyl-CoA decarboxylase [Hyphomicrobiales bacterium]
MDGTRVLDAVERALIPRVALQQDRPTRERLEATLPGIEEALSPRVLRRTLAKLRAIADARIGEVEAGYHARTVAGWYAHASLPERRDCWLLMSEQFAPDPDLLGEVPRLCRDALEGDATTIAEIRLRRALRSPRKRLLQRFANLPEGLSFLVTLRAELLAHLEEDSRLLALDAELEGLFRTWFDVAFLELRRLSWDSPASLIEKLIRYEAVHEIRSWADARNRLGSHRRCYGFFHAGLAEEPLIFVEVALTERIADAIAPLLDEGAVSDPSRATTAVFYSITSTQAGLRGVAFGDTLIKRVVESIRREFPRIDTFATLSPMPGFRRWFGERAAALVAELEPAQRAGLCRELGGALAPETFVAALQRPQDLAPRSAVRGFLLACAARYLSACQRDGKPVDGVARFHLGNGARLERINWAADLSPKGLEQSFGMMVNYLYDPRRIDRHRLMLAAGRVPASGAVAKLLRRGRTASRPALPAPEAG